MDIVHAMYTKEAGEAHYDRPFEVVLAMLYIPHASMHLCMLAFFPIRFLGVQEP